MREPKFHRMLQYNLALLPNAHLAKLEEGVTTTDMARERSGASIGYPGWGLIYHILLSHLDRARRNIIVETGTNWGCTTIVLAQALIDSGSPGLVYTIEIDSENCKVATDNLLKAGVFHKVELINGDSRSALPALVKRLDEIRIAFLDGSHLYEDVLLEFGTIYPKLGEHSLVIFDNTYQIAEPHEDQRVSGALRYIREHWGGQLINLEFVSWYTPGMALWQKEPLNEQMPHGVAADH